MLCITSRLQNNPNGCIKAADMPDLFLRHQKLESIFELLGSKENDITYSIGWALSQCPSLLSAVLSHFFIGVTSDDVAEIKLQTVETGSGITDLEILGPEKKNNLHVIMEAKRGLQLPGETQLRKYALRLKKTNCKHQALVAMAECHPEYAKCHLPKEVEGFPIHYLCWKDLDRLAGIAQGSHAQKRLLVQLQTYLRTIANMQNQESNMVFVVSLGADTPKWSKLSWRQIVNDKHHYFHSTEGRWPKEPPNYIAFRYGGQLQSIHHVESWKIVDEMNTDIPEIEPGEWGAFFLYTLGPAIIPSGVIKTGNIYPSGHVRVMLDLLLTSKTICEAKQLTDKRLSASI